MVVFHFVEYMIFGITIRVHPVLICMVLTVLVIGAIFAGFSLLLKLDPICRACWPA